MRVFVFIFIALFCYTSLAGGVTFIKTACESKWQLFSIEAKLVDMYDDAIYYPLYDKPDDVTVEDYLKSKHQLYPYPKGSNSIKCELGLNAYTVNAKGYYQTLFKNKAPVLTGFLLGEHNTISEKTINSIDIEVNKMKVCFFTGTYNYGNMRGKLLCKNYDLTNFESNKLYPINVSSLIDS